MKARNVLQLRADCKKIITEEILSLTTFQRVIVLYNVLQNNKRQWYSGG